MALSYIDALAETGVDSVKFQVHISEAESSIYEPFRVNFSVQDKTRYEYWKRMEFSPKEWELIKARCEEKEVEFLASPFSNAAVDLLEEIGIKRYKIGSGEVNNLLLLEKISRTNKPVIISSGLSSFEELDETVDFLRSRNVDFSILQCTTAYPTQPEEYGLNLIKELKDRYKVPIGYSDHSGRIETGIAATALGAEIIEFHAVFDRRSFGPDATSSLEINEVKELVSAVRNIEASRKTSMNKENNEVQTELKNIFEKSLAVNKDLKAGHIIQFDDLEAKKPKGFGISASQFVSVMGKKLAKPLTKWDFLTEEDILEEEKE